MLIALDYDGTYTLAPAWWDSVIAAATMCDHEVICATMRPATEPIDMPCKVIYTDMQAKMPFLAGLGIHPDVWIDDKPHRIYQVNERKY